MSDRPNVLLVAIDTLRADHVSCYGYQKRTTPRLDELARDGALFETCIAPGVPTHPSYTTIFTGVHPLRHKIVCHAGSVALSDSIRTLPELMRALGYVTAAVDNLAVEAPWFLRGYEHYIHSGGITVISRGIKVTGRVVTEKAATFLRQWRDGAYGDRPFFLFVHYWDPHAPYLPPEDLIKEFYEGPGPKLEPMLKRTRWGRLLLRGWLGDLIKRGRDDKNYVDASYDAEIRYADAMLGELLDLLRDMGEYDSTLIIVTADHGESMGENQVFYDHHGLYEWDVHVPLIMRLPGVLPRGARVGGLVTHEDVLPTVLEAIGAEPPPDVDGTSLVRLAGGRAAAREFVVCVENTRMTKRAIRTSRWKLIETMRPDIYGRPAGHIELYDLRRGEGENLVDESPDVARELLYELETWYRAKLAGTPDPLATQEISLPVS